MIIKVLGSGCSNCKKLYENTKEAVKIIGEDIEVKYITDLNEILASGVMRMPALVVDNKVVSMGRVASVEDIIKIVKR